MAGALEGLLGMLCHGRRVALRGGSLIKGLYGAFEGFSTIGRVRHAKGNKKAPEGALRACRGLARVRRQSLGPW